MKGLSKTQTKNWKLHYNKKIRFYKKQETDKWRFWPEKTKKRTKIKSYNKKERRNSLTPALVVEAMKHAIQKCRPQWNVQFRNWILKLIKLSMSAGFGKFKDKWYRPATGIPTGGNISVQLANIAIFVLLLAV